MIAAGTGHRPDKLGGYGDEAWLRLCQFASRILSIHRPTKVISGMALGWDQALAYAANQIGIPFIAAIPFEGQDSNWPLASRVRYFELLDPAEEVIVVSEGAFANWKFETRNRWMVDRGDYVLALWNGSSGGTGNCVEYANKKEKTVVNVWPEFELFVGEELNINETLAR